MERKYLIIVLTFMAGLFFVTQGRAQTASYNYIRIRTPRTKVTSVSRLDQLMPVKDSVETIIQYVDGLGRPMQTIQMLASPTGKDIIQSFGYDRFSRDSVKYLPYTITQSTPGAYQPYAIIGTNGTYAASGQFTFYQQSGLGYMNTPYPLTGTNFEPSPMNRPIEQGAPGADWQLSTSGVSTAGHTIKMVYASNDQTTAFVPATLTNNPGCRIVAWYTASINSDQSRTLARVNNNTTYGPQQLSLTISKDENWNSATDGCLSTTEQYKDKEGHVVLKRTYNQKGSALEMLSTYYVYDDRGNLSFVLPPAISPDANTAISQAILDNLCYQYRYDERNRLTQKKIPGKGWEYTVYNFIDQPVATQDSSQRAQHNWIFTKYDGQARVIMTGVRNSGTVNITRAALQDTLTKITANYWESPVATGNGYSNVAWPTNNVTVTLALSYFDRYTGIPGLPSNFTAPSGAATQTRGLMTATKIAVLNTPANMLWTVHYYDDLGRNIKTYKQHYLGGILNTGNYDAVTTTYDFINQPTTITRQHWNTVSTTYPRLTILKKYGYDHMGRTLKTWQQLTNNNSAPDTMRLISQLTYNELGQVSLKRLGSKDSLNFLQNLAYVYNERGWMLSATAPLFTEQLQYNTGTTKAWNGNIMMQSWTSAASAGSFNYTYDRLNRLTSGKSADNKYIERGITYDQAGNIGTLSRVYNSVLVDSLSYNYLSGSNPTNLLQSVNDKSANAGLNGYKTGNWTYAYDGNGNMITDNSKGFTGTTGIVYNLLNLPQSIAAKSTTYTYDATGQKLRRVISATTTDYINGIQYDGGVITFIQTEEGRALPNGTTAYNYEYNLTDHLGDSRLSFDSPTGAARLQQQDNYLPFGMDISVGSIGSPQNNYLFNKKEMQQNLQLYDYGARFYDPVIGRWTMIDPMAEKSPGLTPYRYAFNNPVRVIDPNGAYEEDGHFWTVYLMLTMMGNKNAFNIASWTEWPDLQMYPSGDPAGGNNSWIQPLSQQRIHALTGGFSAMERNRSYGDIETATDSYELGIALHRLGDSYAHSIFGNEGRMYGGDFWSFGHAFHTGDGDPDAIKNRPWLYRMYTARLEQALTERFSYKGTIDMFTFDYVAGSKGDKDQNSAIFETEVRIRQGAKSFSVEGNQVGAINAYVKASNGHFGRSVHAKTVYTHVDVYNVDANGKLVKTKSEMRTFVALQ